MTMQATEPLATTGRAARRRTRTRERLIDAARALIARRGIDDTTIADITEAADVAVGSFYTHFVSKEQLVDGLVAEAIEAHGAALDALVADVIDPAERFALCLRLTIRMADRDRVWAWFTVRSGHYVRELQSGLGERLLRALEHGIESGRFRARDRGAAVIVTGGAVLAAMQGRLLRSLDAPADRSIAESLLVMLGVPADEAERIAYAPLRAPYQAPTRASDAP